MLIQRAAAMASVSVCKRLFDEQQAAARRCQIVEWRAVIYRLCALIPVSRRSHILPVHTIRSLKYFCSCDALRQVYEYAPGRVYLATWP